MPNSPNYSFPYPALSDSPNGPVQIGNLANAVDTALTTVSTQGRRFICTSGTRPASPAVGQEIYETDTTARRFWDGSYWRTSEARTFFVASSADLGISTTATEQAGTGTSITTVASNATLIVTAFFDFEVTVTGTGYCYMGMFLNGVGMNSARWALGNGNVVDRKSLSSVWWATIATPGSQTLSLRGRKDAAGGTAFLRAPGTGYMVTLLD